MFWYEKHYFNSSLNLKKCLIELKKHETLDKENNKFYSSHPKQYVVRWENPKTFYVSVFTYHFYRIILLRPYASKATFKFEISGTGAKPLFESIRIFSLMSILPLSLLFFIYGYLIYYIATETAWWLAYFFGMFSIWHLGYLVYPLINSDIIDFFEKIIDAKKNTKKDK
jgi:hypothetical protein